jgi:hypothetical protein
VRRTHRRTHWVMGSGLYYYQDPVLGTYRSIDFPRIGYRLGLVWYQRQISAVCKFYFFWKFFSIRNFPKNFAKFLQNFFQKIRRSKNPGKRNLNFDFSINFLYNISMKSKESINKTSWFSTQSPYLVGITSDIM